MKKKIILFLCLSLGAFSAYSYHDQKSNNVLVAQNSADAFLGSISSIGGQVAQGMAKMEAMEEIQPMITQAKRLVRGLALAYLIIIIQLFIMIGLMLKMSCSMKTCNSGNKGSM